MGQENYRAMDETVQTKGPRESLVDETFDLHQHALSVQRSFGEVKEALAGLSLRNSSLNPAFRRKCTGLQRSWDSLHKDYVALLWDSREVAGKARAILRDFSSMFLDYIIDPNIRQDRKRADLRQMEKLVEDQGGTLKMCQHVKSLDAEMSKFHQELKLVVDEFSEAVKDPGIMSSVKHDMENISLQLDRIKSEVSDASVTDAPPNSAQIQQEHREAQKKLDVVQALFQKLPESIDKCRVDLNVARALQDALEVISPENASISQKLGVFSAVWETIRVDLLEIEKMHNDSKSPSDATLLRNRVDATKRTYSQIYDALAYYESFTSIIVKKPSRL
ncbi:hypothetical protein BV22DRAFT_1035109 [Leucogyrophana mollusca]|uniref:Uncharacterized protein n=1 Tax=Leucogyrophana mollusca TaxID=85980 RepID=A0ACB8BHZ3_9AGAM|nr:hypothetical protein BV22DRAFT_1035109 [Leucogyrophana mollusca]